MPPFYRWGIKPHPTEEYVSYSSPKNKSAYDIPVSLTPMRGCGEQAVITADGETAPVMKQPDLSFLEIGAPAIICGPERIGFSGPDSHFHLLLLKYCRLF